MMENISERVRPMTKKLASLSLVVEWENADRIGGERAGRMLNEIRSQLAQLEHSTAEQEVIFVYRNDPEVAATIAEAVSSVNGRWSAAIEYLPVGTPDYYEQKNQGAAAARGDLLVFLDSDVVPDSAWLQTIVASFDDPTIEIIGGTTRIEATDLYSKAMALGWFFRSAPDHGISPSPTFLANNVAFRKAAFESYPDTGQYRGQCLALAAEMRRHGKVIHINRAARVSHPPPQGARAFILRALWDGHDVTVALRRARKQPLVRGLGAIGLLLLQRLARVWRDRSKVGLDSLDAAAAMAIILAYHGLAAAGLAAASAAPTATLRHLRQSDSVAAAP